MTGTTQRQTATGWVAHATCAGHDPRQFLEPATPADTRQALSTCNRCPVRSQCLDLALAQPRGGDPGIWGGTTEDDRQRLRDGRDTTRAHTPHPPVTPPQPQYGPPVPQTQLTRDDHGIHHDPTGRIEVCELLRTPRRMVLLDGRPIARTSTLADARRIAWQALHDLPQPQQAATRSRR